MSVARDTNGDTPRRSHVLFVDDEPYVLDGLRRLLRNKRSEWSMTFAQSVDQAWEMLLERPYDALVSDINMPGRSGFDLLELVRAHPDTGDIPVVILTGNGERKLKSRALDLGATDLLNKPVDADELIARVNNVLRLKRYQDEIKRHSAELEQKVRERTASLERSRIELIWRLGKAGEFRDSETGYHVVRVGYFSMELARSLGLDDDFVRRVFLTAPLHDIGKIGIPDSILLKPGKLTESEWEVMRLHTRIGAQILQENVFDARRLSPLGTDGALMNGIENDNPVLEMAARIAQGHHERWNGEGYPEGLAGESIPIEARITSVADVYDALCSRRPYKRAFEQDEVLAFVRAGNGKQFDPAVVNAFERSLGAFAAIREQFADDQETDPHSDVLEAVRDLTRQ